MVRLSDDEKALLESHRDREYSSDRPLGSVIAELVQDEHLDQKTILVTGRGELVDYPNGGRSAAVRIISCPVGDDGKNIRGFGPDLVVLITDIPETVRENVIDPMRCSVVELF